jgi:hypothetical protein
MIVTWATSQNWFKKTQGITWRRFGLYFCKNSHKTTLNWFQLIMATKDMKFKLNFINVAKFKKSSRLYLQLCGKSPCLWALVWSSKPCFISKKNWLRFHETRYQFIIFAGSYFDKGFDLMKNMRSSLGAGKV